MVCKGYEDEKIENRNNEYITQFIETMHCQVSSLSCASITKTSNNTELVLYLALTH